MSTDAPDTLARARAEMNEGQRRLDHALRIVIAEETEFGDASHSAWRGLALGLVHHSNALRELLLATIGAPAPEPSRSHATYTIDHSCYRAIKTYVATTDTRAFEALERLYSFKGGGDASDVKALIEVCDAVGLTHRADFLRNMLEGE